MEFRDHPGAATLYSFAVCGRSFTEAFAVEGVYVLAVAVLDASPHVHVVSNLVDCDPEGIVIGLPLAVRYEPLGAWWVPVFVPAPYPGVASGAQVRG